MLLSWWVAARLDNTGIALHKQQQQQQKTPRVDWEFSTFYCPHKTKDIKVFPSLKVAHQSSEWGMVKCYV